MTLYVDPSALFKRYVAEPGSERVASILSSDDAWATANHAYTELSINLRRRLDDAAQALAIARLDRDWGSIRVVLIDDVLCHRAATLGSEHRLRTLDALHLAAAERAGGSELTFVTFDVRLAAAARSIGFPVAMA